MDDGLEPVIKITPNVIRLLPCSRNLFSVTDDAATDVDCVWSLSLSLSLYARLCFIQTTTTTSTQKRNGERIYKKKKIRSLLRYLKIFYLQLVTSEEMGEGGVGEGGGSLWRDIKVSEWEMMFRRAQKNKKERKDRREKCWHFNDFTSRLMSLTFRLESKEAKRRVNLF